MDVEADKQDQIRENDSDSNDGTSGGAVADICVKAGPNERSVGIGEQGDVDDELANLKCGEVLFPPDLDLEGGHGVVVVHDDMDPKVDYDWNPLRGRMLHQLIPCENEGGGMVVAV